MSSRSIGVMKLSTSAWLILSEALRSRWRASLKASSARQPLGRLHHAVQGLGAVVRGHRRLVEQGVELLAGAEDRLQGEHQASLVGAKVEVGIMTVSCRPGHAGARVPAVDDGCMTSAGAAGRFAMMPARFGAPYAFPRRPAPTIWTPRRHRPCCHVRPFQTHDGAPDVLELLIVVALILLNAFFALSEMALMTSRKIRLKQMGEHSRGARKALALAEHPDNLLSTVQVGITLIGVLTGVFGGDAIGLMIAGWLDDFVPAAREYARPIGIGTGGRPDHGRFGDLRRTDPQAPGADQFRRHRQRDRDPARHARARRETRRVRAGRDQPPGAAHARHQGRRPQRRSPRRRSACWSAKATNRA